MIQFSDIKNSRELIDTESFFTSFKDIKSLGKIDKSQAESFWDNLFENPTKEIKSIEEDIAKDVYGRSEKEFRFDFDVKDPSIQNKLVPFKDKKWDSIPEKEKEKCTRDLANSIGEKLGLDKNVKVVFFEDNPNNCGSFIPGKNIIQINRKLLDNPKETVDTVAHEMRHAYQFERAQKLERYEDYLYAYNFANYISPRKTARGYVNFTEYQDQVVEAEARAFAKIFTGKGAF